MYYCSAKIVILLHNTYFFLDFGGILGEAGGKAHLAGALLVKHAISDIALIAQVALAVMQGDMNGIVVAHVAREVAAQGDERVTGRDRSAELHFQFGGDTGHLQAAREYPVGQFIDEGADDAAMQRLYPAVIIEAGRPGGDDIFAVFPEFQMQADGVCRATPEAVITLLVEVWINELLHFPLLSFFCLLSFRLLLV